MNGFEIHCKNSSKIYIIRMSVLLTCSCSDEWIRDTLKEFIENFYYTYEFYWSHFHALMNGFEIHSENSSKISIIRMSLLVTFSSSDEWIRDTLRELIENFYYTYEFTGHIFILWWMGSRYIERIHRKFLLYVWVYWSHVHNLMNGFEIHWKNSTKISIRMSLLVTFSCSDEWVRDTLKEFIENFYYTYEFTGHMFMLWWMDSRYIERINRKFLLYVWVYWSHVHALMNGFEIHSDNSSKISIRMSLLVTCSCSDEWIRDTLKELIENFYTYEFTGHIFMLWWMGSRYIERIHRKFLLYVWVYWSHVHALMNGFEIHWKN